MLLGRTDRVEGGLVVRPHAALGLDSVVGSFNCHRRDLWKESRPRPTSYCSHNLASPGTFARRPLEPDAERTQLQPTPDWTTRGGPANDNAKVAPSIVHHRRARPAVELAPVQVAGTQHVDDHAGRFQHGRGVRGLRVHHTTVTAQHARLLRRALGLLRVLGDDGPADAAAGALFVAPRGHRHGFSNPHDTPARVLGLWSPAGLGLAFMRDVGRVLPPSGPADPDAVAEIYRRHASPPLPD